MITPQEIKQFALNEGLEVVEIFPNTSLGFVEGKIYDCLSKTNYHYQIGIELKKNVYYWWEAFIADTNSLNDFTLLFAQRYNQSNGAIQKSYKKGWTAEDLIQTSLKSMPY